jgi:carboxypeptidase C (cathepsin A)
MRRPILALALTAAVAALGAPPLAGIAQTAPAPTPSPSPRPVPRIADAITHHSITLHGRRIAYTARAGTLVLRDADDAPTASVFYVAYTADGAQARTRPVTFFWNGGPGSSTIWLHMGSFGPVRVEVPANGTQPRPNPPLATNESSLLDTSDLVFIDAVGTGWSRTVGKAKGSDFWGVDEDASAFAQFIQRYVTRFARWESPKFLFGESYGTTRAANVVNVLQSRDNIAVNGVVLLSSALDYNLLPIGQGPGQDLVYVGYLPTEACVAWYHHKIARNPADLSHFAAEVRAFAGGEYASALRRGDALDAAERARIVARLHQYTGLSTDYIEAANLRIDPNKFRAQLLRDEGRDIGRYDGRYSGHQEDPNGAYPQYDPSDTMTSAAFVTAFNHYLHDVLHYRNEQPYDVLDYGVNQNWKYQRGQDPNGPSVVADLKAALVENPSLHVLSANGYYDLATGFYGTEYLLHHMGLKPADQARVHYVYFPSGHEVYLNHDALVSFKGDLVRFYAAALGRSSAPR